MHRDLNKDKVTLMKKFWLIPLWLCVVSLLAPSAALAKGKGKKNATGSQPNVFAQYDANGNGVLDPDEKEAIRKAFANGDQNLKVYDTNGDGKLSDDEIAKIQPPPEPTKGKKKKR